MTTRNDIRDLAQQIYETTKARKLTWQDSSTVSTFFTSLGKGSLVISRPIEINPMEGVLYELNFLNANGENIGMIYCKDREDIDYKLLEDIYNEAEDTTLKVNETFDSMRDHLATLNLPF